MEDQKKEASGEDGDENADGGCSDRVAAAVPLPRVAVHKDTANRFEVVLVEGLGHEVVGRRTGRYRRT